MNNRPPPTFHLFNDTSTPTKATEQAKIRLRLVRNGVLGILLFSILCFWSACGSVATCQTNKDCQSDAPYCVLAKCKSCANDDHCKKGERCDLQQGTCLSTSSELVTHTESTIEQAAKEQTTTEKTSKEKQQLEPVLDASSPDEPMPPEISGDTVVSDKTEKPDTPSLVCKPGQSESCGPKAVGICKKGKRYCNTQGQWDTCQGAVRGTKEKCDGVDNDCDGLVDEDWKNLGQACSSGKFLCKRTGKYICNAQQTETICNAKAAPPQPEKCDGVDNDCNGQIDETFPNVGKACTLGLGECQRKGKLICSAGGKSAICDAKVGTKKAETCDNKDNDCDGQIDNGIKCQCSTGQSRPCGKDKGQCKKGLQTCRNGAWGLCIGQINATIETCNNKDDDCDGLIDESLSKGCYSASTGCSSSGGSYQCKGSCRSGNQICQRGKWTTCAGEIKPTTELCDGLDNDCDGKTDEAFSRLGKSCRKGMGNCQTNGKYICDNKKTATTCNAKTGTPQSEVCNKKDDNCDGLVDNNTTGSGKLCTVTGQQGECQKGQTACNNGTISCTQVVSPKSESCNGKDDDCDGSVDENLSLGSCSTGKPGICATGQNKCIAGKLTCEQTSTKVTEICRNQLDDDCDGKIDEICGPLHAYAIIGSFGSVKKSRELTAKKTPKRTGEYTLTLAASFGSCTSHPIFLTPIKESGAKAAYQCKTSSSGVSAYSVEMRNYTNRLDSMRFHAVVPAKKNGEVFGVMNDTNCHNTATQVCSLSNPYGTASIKETTSGTYEITAAACATNPNQPIMVQIISVANTNSRYVRTEVKNGKCYVYIEDYSGTKKSHPFAYWLVDVSTNAYVTIDKTGSILAKNNFGDQTAKWSITKQTATIQYTIGFDAWIDPSAVLFSSTHSKRQGFLADPATNNIKIRALRAFLFGAEETSFSMLFVQ